MLTLLGNSIREGNVDAVKHLCCNLHVDTNEICYMTPAGVELPPLLWARFWGGDGDSEGIIQILLDSGADVSVTNDIIAKEGISNLLCNYDHIFEEYGAAKERRLKDAMAILWVGRLVRGDEHQDLFWRDVSVEVVTRYLAACRTDWTLKRY